MDTKLYSIADLSKILDLHPKTVLRFINEGKLHAKKIGRTWRVSEDDLKIFCHGEFSNNQTQVPSVDYDTLASRISVSAVIEIKEQNSEEASRISNSIMAMLNSDRDSDGKSRFDFFYYPEIEKAKYVFYGNPQFVGRIIDTFELLCGMKGEVDE
jgi:excisionase family DNA binding protein